MQQNTIIHAPTPEIIAIILEQTLSHMIETGKQMGVQITAEEIVIAMKNDPNGACKKRFSELFGLALAAIKKAWPRDTHPGAWVSYV